jgi:hypothetical protein
MSTQQPKSIEPLPESLVTDPPTFPEVTTEIETQLREVLDQIIVPRNSSYYSNHLHIPNENGESYCHGTDFEPIEKPVECYPKGFKKFCKRCVTRYRIQLGE